MTSLSSPPPSAAEAVTRFLSEICGGDAGAVYAWCPPRRFSDHAERLQTVVNQFVRWSETPSGDFAAVQTAFRGISGDLADAVETLRTYRDRSRIYVLIHSLPLCEALRDRSIAIGRWLALLEPSLASNADLRKKVVDLSVDMQNPGFSVGRTTRVGEVEKRVHLMLQKEAESRQQTSKAVQSAILMDLARALGMDPMDHGALSEQIKLLKKDLSKLSTVSERRILTSLEAVIDSWSSIATCISLKDTGVDDEEDDHIPPFKNFICPLTKEVMREPVVVLETSQTYERVAIGYWFSRCIEDGRDPTCPVTGQALMNLEVKPNIGLAGAIEEWINRNVDAQIRLAMRCLEKGEGDVGYSVEDVKRTLESVYRMLDDYPSSRHKARNAGIVVLVVRLLKARSGSEGSQMRGKAFMVLHSMSKDDESKLIMFEEGMTRLATRSLTGSSEEKEFAVKLLLELSRVERYCKKIAVEKGALFLLTSMAGSLEHPNLSNLAEEVLKNAEKAEENIQPLAEAGRFQPLIGRLCTGTEDDKVGMAYLLGKLAMTNQSKEYIVKNGAKALVGMLSSKADGRTSSLQALANLSTSNDNTAILVDLGILPALTNILVQQEEISSDLKELAASIVANIVSKSGQWELALADKEGHSLQSEFIIHKFLGLFLTSSSKCQVLLLQVLHGIAVSPQASVADSVAMHIKSGDGIALITSFLQHPEREHRRHAFKLTCVLSLKLGQALADDLRASGKLPLFKEKLLDAQCSVSERSEAACIIANLPLSDDEVKTFLGTDLLGWLVTNIKEQQSNPSGRSGRRSNMVEGLLGITLHFARSTDRIILETVRQHHLMSVFRDHLSIPSHHRAKRRAALGLKYLSESARVQINTDSDPQPPRGFCVPLVFVCGKAPVIPKTCPLHNIACEEDSSFCLLKGGAIKPLGDLLHDENTEVQIAAVESLSTILSDPQSLKYAAGELTRVGVTESVVGLFKEARVGELQERVIWMVERLLRVDDVVEEYSMDQALVTALADAFKHGNANTKRCSQDALTNLRQISGVGGKKSGHSRGGRASGK
ncbi:U-box domain-containing protein 44 [Acorus gramineus]|uniref:RING-type E3 ubiquitin transferase n=1 Tax=Acorus gramineus TaxID=55184 RepID=A0AAV9AKB9_ACOGR|nr:U-box domain-containing protein 44 [Acorus gramineus]